MVCLRIFSLSRSLGNSINIAGKDRYLTSDLLLQTEKYLDGTSDASQLKELIGDHNYTVHIIRHAFDDMKGYESENVIKRAIYDRGN